MRDPAPPTGLRKARLLKGWGVKALAEAIDVEESTIWRIEAGRTKEPTSEHRIALAKALGVSAAKLFGKM
jgi:transcriptional regulator with XRE-family HTH domain